MSVFVTTNEEIDAAVLEQEVTEAIEVALEGWKPAQGDLLEWENKAFSRIGASVFGQAATMERGAFKSFGEAIVSVPPIKAAPATAESTWTMVDKAGYTIPAGTQVTIAATGDEAVGFVTVGETVVAPGANTATVLLQAVESGEAGNELTANPELQDALAFVEGIVLVGTTANGVDEEEEDAYLSRLVENTPLFSLSLVVGKDFEADGRAVSGIARCKCIEAYNGDTSSEQALHVTTIPIDESGLALSAPTKTALKERQQDKVLSGITVHVIDPTYTQVDVAAEVIVQTGFDSATVIAAVEARLAEYFSPAKWGAPTSGESTSGWENRPEVYRFELISEIDRVGGVDRVASLKLAKHGEGLTTAEELALAGIAPLTKAGTFTITAA